MEGTQKQIVIGLVAVAVLLAAIVGVLIWQNSKNAVPSPTLTDTGTDEAPAGMPATANTTAPPAEFDPATAPKVAEGQTPEAYVKAYYQACQDKKYDEAFKMLPTATQAYYGDTAGFQSTLEGYGVTAFSVQPQKEAGDAVTVVGSQTAQGMDFPYTWKFVKGDSGEWLCESRTMGAQ
ncbi:MAG: hypothetical protein CVT60_06150 [Actinobacteria bacterium HGW-Actinobacteria-10]|jgi:uncharacterized iron-regulated membrane protein|nr:MAG: hypothetical protein CVT60_06150 [Actinobacteria bacterium HGW-Actinobacteria-10]